VPASARRTGTVTAFGIVLGAYLVFPYESRTAQAALRPYLEPEAYRVYDAILPENPAYADAVSTLIRGKTISYDPDCLRPDVRYRAHVTAAIADFIHDAWEEQQASQARRSEMPLAVQNLDPFAQAIQRSVPESRQITMFLYEWSGTRTFGPRVLAIAPGPGPVQRLKP
jgi:hypothetical protein